MKKPIVIAIAAVSGGGKTTVINELDKKFPHSKSLYFDDYEFEKCPDDFFEWIRHGADYNEWDLELLRTDIKSTLLHQDIDYLFLDYPFAYQNKKIAPLIDYAIFIDTPLDIAMARRILRDMLDEPKDHLADDLNYYLTHGRIAYLEMLNTIKPNSDAIIDGSQSFEGIISQILEQLPRL